MRIVGNHNIMMVKCNKQEIGPAGSHINKYLKELINHDNKIFAELIYMGK